MELRVRAGADRRAPVRAGHQRSRLLPALGVLIVAILILQLTLLVVAVLAARGYSAKSANASVTGSATVMSHSLDQYFASAETGAGLVSYAITARDPADGDNGLAEVLYQFLVLTTEVSGVHIVHPDGSTIEVTRQGNDFALTTVTAGGLETTEQRDGRFVLVSSVTGAVLDDPRDSLEYSTAAATRLPQWLAPRVDERSRTSRIPYSLPVIAPSGELVAVVWVEVSLDSISKELDSATLSNGSATLLVDADQRVVAAPSPYERQVHSYELATGEGIPITDLGLQLAAPLEPVSPTITDAAGTSSLRRANGWLVVEQRVFAGGVPDVRVYVQSSPELAVPGAAELIALFRAIAIALALSALVTPVIAWAVRGRMSIMASRAAHDHLTGIANRDEVIRLVPRMMLESRDAGFATCVLMFDVDNFKELNDALGHDAGDRALITIVEALEEAMRGSDVCGRWGGDEFIVIMSLPPDVSAAAAVDRLRRHAESALVQQFPGLDLGITAGFAVSSGDVRDFDALTSAADDALVAGKREAKSRSYAAM